MEKCSFLFDHYLSVGIWQGLTMITTVLKVSHSKGER
jgi:hypothetical protein